MRKMIDEKTAKKLNRINDYNPWYKWEIETPSDATIYAEAPYPNVISIKLSKTIEPYTIAEYDGEMQHPQGMTQVPDKIGVFLDIPDEDCEMYFVMDLTEDYQLTNSFVFNLYTKKQEKVLFRDIEGKVYLKETNVRSNEEGYPYRAYITQHLSD